MSDPALHRFPCPHCGKVLKTRADWAGRSAICPSCSQPFTVPVTDAAPPSARTARQLETLVAGDDAPALDERAADDLALYLAQGTCREFALARTLLAGRALSARQWRRILASAAAQENLRLRVHEVLAQPDPVPEDAAPIPLLAAGEDTAPNAWTILARYLYFLAHDTCEACRDDLTGQSCIYRTFDELLAVRRIAAERTAGWHSAMRHSLGL